jgi:hypothetical protein
MRQYQVTPPDKSTYVPEVATVANNEQDLIKNICLMQMVRTGSAY